MKIKNTKLWLLVSLLLILSTKEGFLQFDPERSCPNGPLSSLGVLISLVETEDDEGYFVSLLKPDERKPYEERVKLKRSFASTMKYIPQSFTPELPSYLEQLNTLIKIFFVIAFFPLVCIIFYLIIRFCCKKCAGPRKISEVNKNYRNITWVMLVVSCLASLILLGIIFAKSLSVTDGIKTSFNAAADQIAKNDAVYGQINSVVQKFREKNLDVPDSAYMADFKQNIEKYIADTKDRTNEILTFEKRRQKYMLIVFIVIIVLAVLSNILFFLKLEKMECLLSIIILLTLPCLIVFEGYNASFFFYYGDLCDTVHGALHRNEIPVADQGLGYYYNCFPLKTKAQLYTIRYKLYAAYNNAIENQKEFESLYETVNTNTFEPIFKCKIASEVVPEIEKDFCKDSLDNLYTLLLLLTWLLLSLLLLAIATRRLEFLIWKRRMEIESMIQNQEVMF